MPRCVGGTRTTNRIASGWWNETSPYELEQHIILTMPNHCMQTNLRRAEKLKDLLFCNIVIEVHARLRFPVADA